MRPYLAARALAPLAAVALALAACADGDDSPLSPSITGAATAPSTSHAGAAGPLTTSLNGAMCVDVFGESTEPNARVVLWQCHGGRNQQWTYTADNELRAYGTMCLDAPGAMGNDGDQLIIWPCHGGANQKWERTAAGELRGINGKCVDAWANRAENGTRVTLYTCHGGTNQKWQGGQWTAAPAVPAAAPAAPGAPSPAPSPAPAPAPASPSIPADGPGKVFALMGAVPSVGAVEALGGTFAKYEQDFRVYAELHWSLDGANWLNANYYDRAMIYYVWWARTGNQAYLDRANALVLSYRRGYVEANNYGFAPHWAMLDGLALHYLLTGDEASRVAVGRAADVFAAPYYVENLGRTSAEMENRMQARVLLSFVLANYIKAPSRNGHDWAVRSRDALTKILASQSTDGAYRFSNPTINQCGHNKPWMVGLLNDAMIRYHTLFEADGRIAPSIKRAVDYMWANDWRSASRGFVYLAGVCNGQPVGAAPDVNNLISSGFGFVYKQTGDAAYRTRGDEVFAGGVQASFLPGAKQFNQEYTSGYRYLSLRQ